MPDYQKFSKNFVIGVGLASVYFFAARLGLILGFANAGGVAVWPADGIALAALLVFGYRYWPAILLGAFLANFTGSGAAATSAAIALGNTLEPLLGAFLVNNFAGGKRVFENSQNVFKFIFFAALIAAVCATIGVTASVLGGLAGQPQYLQAWVIWWVADLGGSLFVAPFLILLVSPGLTKWHPAKIIEAAIYLTVFVAVARLVFGGAEIFGSRNSSLDFLYIPLLLWAVFRFDRREVSGAIIALSWFAFWQTLKGFGPFVARRPDESVLLLQAFLIIISTGSLIVSALIGEREKLRSGAIDYNQNLAREKARAEALVADIGEGLMAVDDRGKIITVNKTFEDLLGWQARDVLGQDVSKVMFLEDEQGKTVLERQSPLKVAFATGKKIVADYYLIRKNKTRFLAAITSTPLVLDGKIAGAIKLFRDVTEEKQIDRSKNEFVSLASHQLRTPLTVIKWHASRLLDALARKTLKKTEEKEYLKQIYSTNEHMMDLVSAILNVSKIDLGMLSVEPEHVHLEDIFTEVIRELALQMKDKKLKIKKVFKEPLPAVKADPQLMRIVFQNLLSNSIKYTPNGGKITCGLEFKSTGLLVTVQDTGCGIPKKDQEKIFSKFFRTEAARAMDPNGNGLGVYIVKAVVDLTGGKIWFESEEGLGTTFYVIIPLTGMQHTEGAKGLAESSSSSA